LFLALSPALTVVLLLPWPLLFSFYLILFRYGFFRVVLLVLYRFVWFGLMLLFVFILV